MKARESSIALGLQWDTALVRLQNLLFLSFQKRNPFCYYLASLHTRPGSTEVLCQLVIRHYLSDPLAEIVSSLTQVIMKSLITHVS